MKSFFFPTYNTFDILFVWVFHNQQFPNPVDNEHPTIQFSPNTVYLELMQIPLVKGIVP